MANSVVQKQFHSVWRSLYILWALVIIVWLIWYGFSFAANAWIDHRIASKEEELSQIKIKVDQLGTEKSFFSYNFAQSITSDGMIKWSDHIKTLIEVLNQIQDTSYIGANAIKLSDFTISPKQITLKGKVSDLLLLYYSSPEKWFMSVIDRFTSLPFISNVKIRQYTKSSNYYAFTLTADIDLHAALQPNTAEQSAISGATIMTGSSVWSGNQ